MESFARHYGRETGRALHGWRRCPTGCATSIGLMPQETLDQVLDADNRYAAPDVESCAGATAGRYAAGGRNIAQRHSGEGEADAVPLFAEAPPSTRA